MPILIFYLLDKFNDRDFLMLFIFINFYSVNTHYILYVASVAILIWNETDDKHKPLNTN